MPESTGEGAGAAAGGGIRTIGSMDDTVTRQELLAEGWTVHAIAASVRLGVLIRVRRGHYAAPTTDANVQRAVRVGGLLACVSELRFREIWTPQPAALHVHVAVNAARLRNPDDRARRIRPGDCVVHWSVLVDPGGATASHVSIVDALAEAVGCLDPWFAVAAIDSALNRGDVSLPVLRARLAAAPIGIVRLLDQVDGRAQSGLETLVRLLAKALGFRVAVQVRFAGIGIVDLVVEGWVVIETDGGEHHDTAIVAARDRRRDARHAAAGRTALRFRYQQVVHELPTVAAAIIGAVRSHRRIRNSGELARRAEIRVRHLGIS